LIFSESGSEFVTSCLQLLQEEAFLVEDWHWILLLRSRENSLFRLVFFLRECSLENVIALLEVEVLGTLGALRLHSLVSGVGFLSEL
jgi:hypothetical protein